MQLYLKPLSGDVKEAVRRRLFKLCADGSSNNTRPDQDVEQARVLGRDRAFRERLIWRVVGALDFRGRLVGVHVRGDDELWPVWRLAVSNRDDDPQKTLVRCGCGQCGRNFKNKFHFF